MTSLPRWSLLALLFWSLSAIGFTQAPPPVVPLGIALSVENGITVIGALQPGGTAEKSGLLKVGDRILAVAPSGGESVWIQGIQPSEVGDLIRGPVGTTVRLTIQSPGDAAPRDVSIVRAAVNPLLAWGETGPVPSVPPGATVLPVWAIPHLAPMRTQGSYLVILPPDYATSGRTYPICVLLHGRGGSDLTFGPIVTQLGREGVIYVAIRAPYPEIATIVATRNPSYTTGPADFLPPNAPELDTARRDYVDWIFDAVADVRKNYRVRDGKIFLFGYSQGGGMAHNAAALYPERIQSYFAQSGSAPWQPFVTDPAVQKMKAAGVRVWMVHGRDDDVVTLPSVNPHADRLRAAGLPLEFRVVPGAHTITQEMFAAAREWLAKEVRGAP